MNQPELFHDPTGWQHPYQTMPYERQPYQPIVGKPVQFGAVARPADAFQRVWVEWQVGQNSPTQIPAALIAQQEGEGHWQAVLYDLPLGEPVEYWFCGLSGKEETRIGPFRFSPTSWRTARLCAPVQESTDGLVLEYGLTGCDEIIRLLVSIQNSQVRFLWGQGDERSSENTAHPDTITLAARANADGCVEILRDGQVLLREATAPEFLVDNTGSLLQVRQHFVSAADEAFYGFGERFNALDQRGNVLDTCVFEQYSQRGKRTYFPIPFFLSSKGYGLWVETTRPVTFDLAASDSQRWSFTADLSEEGQLTVRFFGGTTLKQNLAAFSAATGPAVLPPDWTFGLWVSSNDWDSQSKVMEELRLAKEHDIPASVLVIEAWSDEINFYIWNDAEYTPLAPDRPVRLSDFTFPPEGRWPDPKGMADAIHAAGTRLVLWQIPVLKWPKKFEEQGNPQHDADEAYMIENRYCAMMPSGDPYRVRPGWFNNGLLLDVTNPDALAWWFSKRRYLLEDLGVDGFKTDGGEHLWCREAQFSGGRSGHEVWNEYPQLYQKAFADFCRSAKGSDFVLFSRAGFTGAQQVPTHWTGDEYSTWEAYRASLLAMQNAGLSGVPFVGMDIGGFGGALPTVELYLRATAAAVFCPVMQYHSDYWRGTPSRDRSPWNIQACSGDERVIPIFRQFVQLRNRLLEYIQREAKRSVVEG